MSKYIKEEVEVMLKEHKENEAKLTEIKLKEEEYQEILATIRNFREKIRENEKDVEKINLFDELMESLAIKEGMEAENQFKLGFQLATKLIIEGME